MRFFRRRPIDGFGFDVDGVFRPTAHRAYLALCEAIREYGGRPLGYPDFVHHYDNDRDPYYRLCGLAEADFPHIQPAYRKHVGDIDETPPFPDVGGVLDHIRDLGLKVFVVSGHPTELLRKWFSTHGIDDHFLGVHGGSADKQACIRRACSELTIDPTRVVYVGDWGLDMRAACDVGCVPVGITRGHGSRKALRRNGATHVVERLDRLLPLLR